MQYLRLFSESVPGSPRGMDRLAPRLPRVRAMLESVTRAAVFATMLLHPSAAFGQQAAGERIGVRPAADEFRVRPSSRQRVVLFTMAGLPDDGIAGVQLTCSAEGAVRSCHVDRSAITRDAGSWLVPVVYFAPAEGNGSVRLRARHGDAEVEGSYAITAENDAGTMALPGDGGSGNPMVFIEPIGGTYSVSQVSVEITWCHSSSLDASSRSITLNGRRITSTFSYVSQGFGEACVEDYHYLSSGTVTLSEGSNTIAAQICDYGGRCGSDSSILTYSPLPEPPVGLGGVNALATRDRGHCVAVALAVGRAECGDLRLAHALPAVRTMSRARQPVLTYVSGHANPHMLVPVNYQLPSSASVPTWVVATLKTASGSFIAEQKWAGSQWTPGAIRRIVFDLIATGYQTGLHRFTLTISRDYSGSRVSDQTVSVEHIVVNRSASPFGAGWWMAGLERLHFAGGDTIVWVGGDGSSHFYVRQGTGNVYERQLLDSPDRLVYNSSGGNATWTRELDQGVEVEFDAAGLHRATLNRNGHATRFGYDTSGRLSTITLPVVSGSAPVYYFDYGTQIIAQVRAPGPVSQRTTTVAASGRRITGITDPDGRGETFGYPSSTSDVITRRTSGRGYATTYSYDSGSKIRTASIATTNHTIVHTIFARESAGIAGAAVSTGYPTIYDGPRSDVDDRTYFYHADATLPWIWKLRDAASRQTILTRANSRYPALVTQMQHPNGFVQQATYTEWAALRTRTDLNPLGDGRNAASRYEYTELRWPYAPNRMVAPQGDSIVRDYDDNGNVLWQQDGRGSISRSDFTYDTRGLLVSARNASNRSTNYWEYLRYDALGNQREHQNELGHITYYTNDAVGQTTLVRSPIDLSQTQHHEQRYFHDAMGRDTLSESFGPAMQYLGSFWADGWSDASTLRLRKTYDASGNLIRAATSVSPDPNGLGAGVYTVWEYDEAERKTSEHHSAATARDSYVFDPAGNVTEQRNGRGHATRMYYDALNRLTRRELPAVFYPSEASNTYGESWSFPRYALDEGGTDPNTLPDDVQTFAYDVAGNMTAADNRYARIRRGYYPSGLLRADTLTVPPLAQPYGSTGELYVVGHAYDLNGRRLRTDYPATAPGTRQATYAYDAASGLLTSVRDPGSNLYTFGYDGGGLLNLVQRPGSVREDIYYRPNGLRDRRTIQGGSISVSDLHEYDARGKLLGGESTPSYALGDYRYDGQGHLMLSTQSGRSRDLWLDALGNVYREQFYTPPPGESEGWVDFEYGGNGQLDNTQRYKDEGTNDPQVGAASYRYDADGNRQRQETHDLTGYETGGDGRYVYHKLWERTQSYYAADGRLRATDRQVCRLRQVGEYASVSEPDPFGAQGGYCEPWDTNMAAEGGLFQRYYYDALGRRIRSGADFNEGQCSSAVRCVDYTEVIVWDGDQVLAEKRNSSWVHYAHAGSIDRPISLAWSGSTIVPLANYRGAFDQGVYTDGSKTSGPANLGAVEWSDDINPWRLQELDSRTWIGNLANDHRDPSGLLYRRNRYYDPTSGVWTQIDPIGLAGGLNLYGFADGDPITFTDPFGLCPFHQTGIPCSTVYGLTGATVGGTMGATVGAAGGSLALPGGGTIVGAATLGVAGVAIGGAGGAVVGLAVDVGQALQASDVGGKVRGWIRSLTTAAGIMLGGGEDEAQNRARTGEAARGTQEDERRPEGQQDEEPSPQ